MGSGSLVVHVPCYDTQAQQLPLKCFCLLRLCADKYGMSGRVLSASFLVLRWEVRGVVLYVEFDW